MCYRDFLWGISGYSRLWGGGKHGWFTQFAISDGDVECGIYTAGNVIFALRASVTFPTVLITIYRLRRTLVIAV